LTITNNFYSQDGGCARQDASPVSSHMSITGGGETKEHQYLLFVLCQQDLVCLQRAAFCETFRIPSSEPRSTVSRTPCSVTTRRNLNSMHRWAFRSPCVNVKPGTPCDAALFLVPNACFTVPNDAPAGFSNPRPRANN
jgi:hypothetical protein